MSRAITFDTLAFAKKIESSGLASKHAESIAEIRNDYLDYWTAFCANYYYNPNY